MRLKTSRVSAKPAGMSNTDYVCAFVRRSILSGDLGPNDRLRERELEVQLKVSRTPIREAMKTLEAQGVIRLEPWKGAVISHLDRQQVIALHELRILLEEFAVRRAAERATPKELDEIESTLVLSESADEDDHFALQALNTHFHRSLCALSHNRFVQETLDNLEVSFALMRGNAYGEKGHWAQVNREHRKIFRAVSAGDGDKAAKLTRNHIFEAGVARLRQLDCSASTPIGNVRSFGQESNSGSSISRER